MGVLDTPALAAMTGAGDVRFDLGTGTSRGQGHLTALGVLIGAERLLGLDGEPPAEGGLVFPESAIDPDRALARLRAFGVHIEAQS